MNAARDTDAGGSSARTWLPALVLVIGVFLGYAEVGSFDFVNYDDPTYVVANERVLEGLSADGVAWAFTSQEASNWHPVTWLSHMLDVSLFGVDAGAHHAVNAVLHAVAAVLLYLFLFTTTRRVWPALFAAAFFAWHPLRVESVAWVSERKDVLSGVFFMATLLAYARYARAPGIGRYLLVVALFALGLMAKPMLVTVPCVLLLLDVWPLGRLRSADDSGTAEYPRRSAGALLVEKVPLFLLAAGASVLTMAAQTGAKSSFEEVSLGLRVQNALAALGAYLRQTAWPVDLACFYPHRAMIAGEPGLLLPAIVSGIVVALVTGILVWRRRALPFALVGWLWFLGTLVPVIGLVQVGFQAHADRYTYLPSIGLAVALVYGAAELVRARPRLAPALCGAGGVALAALLFLSTRQAAVWRDYGALWNHAIETAPPNWLAHQNLGRVRADEGRLDEARAHFEESLAIRPGTPPHDPEAATVHYNLGGVHALSGRPLEAIASLRRAIELGRDDVEAHGQVGQLLASQGKDKVAVEHLSRAVELDPEHREARNLLAWVLATSRSRKVRDGERAFELARDLCAATGFQEARFLDTLAAAQAERGQFDKAERWITVAIEILGDEDGRRRAWLRMFQNGRPVRKGP